LRSNLYNIPVLFLYVDFFVPLLYVGLLLVMMFFTFKYLFVEFKYKFLGDYDAKHSVVMLQSNKYFDMILDKFNLSGHGLLSFGRNLRRGMFKSLEFNMVLIIIFLMFIICWDYSLIKNINFANL